MDVSPPIVVKGENKSFPSASSVLELKYVYLITLINKITVILDNSDDGDENYNSLHYDNHMIVLYTV